MRTFFIYLQLELKRTLKGIPFFLAGAAALAVFAGAVAFSAGGVLHGEKKVGEIAVGVVAPKDDRLAEQAVRMIASLDSVGSLCKFRWLEEDEGKKLLKDGEILALMKLPDQLLQGIMNGENPPVTVFFPEYSGAEAAVFKELTEAGASILGTSQAAIYAADQYLAEQGRQTQIGQAEKDLNTIFLKYALSREQYFKTKKVLASGDVSPIEFFGISAVVFVLLILGIPAVFLVSPYSRAAKEKLMMIGIGSGKRTFVRTLSLSALFCSVSVVPALWCHARGISASGIRGIFVWLLVCVSAAGWILFIYECCHSVISGILILFFSTSVMLFFSGGIIPGVFLPDSFLTIGSYLPTAVWIDAVKWILKGGNGNVIGKLFLLECVIFVLTAWISSPAGREYE